MKFSVNLPINQVSFGQVSCLLMRGFFKRKIFPHLFSISNPIDVNAQSNDEDFYKNIQKCAQKSYAEHSRDIPTLKLWHFNGGLESFSKHHSLLTFYELDQPTEIELNVAKNCDNLIFTSHYAQKIFKDLGVDSKVIPLAFDSYHFKNIDKKYFNDDRIVFNLCGKFEKRKHHAKIIKAWAKKFGNNKKYFLQCSIYNQHLNEEQNKSLFQQTLEGKEYFNIQFLGYLPTNVMYNDYLNSSSIVIGMSGGEGWGLPEFHSVGLGKHAVILDASGYKEWANEDNSVLVKPSGKIEVYDGMFFNKGQPFNQGNIFDFNEDEFIAGCEKAIEKYESNPINEEGKKIQKDFTIDKTIDKLLEIMES